MSKHYDVEPEEHGTRSPTQHGEERDPKRVQRVQIQRVPVSSSYSPRPVQRAVQRFLQRSGGTPAPQADDDLGARIQMHAGGGTGLDPSAKGKLEGTLGEDLSDVRVHTGGEADKMARSVDSVAFTSGKDIFFSDGAYDPGSKEGMQLLAHEATHTVQQGQGPVAGTPSAGGVSISDPSDSFEQAATRTAERVVEDESGGATPARGHGDTEQTPSAQRAVQREAAPATQEETTARNWLAMLPRANATETTAAAGGQQQVLEALRRYRTQLVEDSAQYLINYGKRYGAHPTYNGKLQGDTDPSELNIPIPEETKREMHIDWLVWSELKNEGGESSINIWDDQLQNRGGGVSGVGQTRDVLETLFDAKEIVDPTARAMFLAAGVALDNGNLLVADAEKGVVEEGPDALELLRQNQALLSLLVAAAEDPARGQSVVQALHRAFRRHAGKVPDFVYREWREERDDSIVVLAHLSQWMPSFGWENQPSEYQKTYGDLEKILIAFGKLAGQLHSPSGAYIVYDYLKTLDEDHLGRFGEGVGKKGVAIEAFKGQAPLELTPKEIAENDSYRDHVFFPIPGKAAYYALPAVPAPPEKGAEPPAQSAPAKQDGGDSSGDKDKNKGKGKGSNTGTKNTGK